jgi:hypothetical protein
MRTYAETRAVVGSVAPRTENRERRIENGEWRIEDGERKKETRVRASKGEERKSEREREEKEAVCAAADSSRGRRQAKGPRERRREGESAHGR